MKKLTMSDSPGKRCFEVSSINNSGCKEVRIELNAEDEFFWRERERRRKELPLELTKGE